MNIQFNISLHSEPAKTSQPGLLFALFSSLSSCICSIYSANVNKFNIEAAEVRFI